MKNLIKLAALLGVTGIPDGATEDQIAAALEGFKPKEKNVVIDFEDAAVKEAFKNFITAETKPLTDKITAVETENTRLNNLIKSGATGGGNPPVPGAGGAGGNAANTKTRAEFNAMSHQERNEFMAAKGKIIP